MTERFSPRSEKLNEDSRVFSAMRATDYLPGFAALSKAQPLIMLSELLC